jgi:hypothetical protein
MTAMTYFAEAQLNRHETLTAKGLEERLQELDQQIESWTKEVERNDQRDNFQPKADLPRKLEIARARQEADAEALKTVREKDAQRKKNQQIHPAKNPAQIPMTDPDSRLMPNKEGGHAPNYTPFVAVSVKGDFIVATEVINGIVEHTHTVSVVDQVESDFGIRPDAVLADGHHATGPNIKAIENSQTELISPLAGGDFRNAQSCDSPRSDGSRTAVRAAPSADQSPDQEIGQIVFSVCCRHRHLLLSPRPADALRRVEIETDCEWPGDSFSSLSLWRVQGVSIISDVRFSDGKRWANCQPG